MSSSDWRSPAAYAHAKSIPAAGFAWEYLRRDEDYRRDFHRMRRLPRLDGDTQTAFSERWGLRFPGGSGSLRRPGRAVLDAISEAEVGMLVNLVSRRRFRRIWLRSQVRSQVRPQVRPQGGAAHLTHEPVRSALPARPALPARVSLFISAGHPLKGRRVSVAHF
jgi:hypothetical protein